MKKLLIVALMGLLVFGFSGLAKAEMLIDFDTMPQVFAQDDGYSDVSHNLVTSYGTISFNGNIDNTLNGGDSYSDNTTGDGYFLKNTLDVPQVTLNFNFDVAAVDFYWLGLSDVTMNGAIYNSLNGFVDGGSENGSEEWIHVFAGPFATSARSMSFWSDNGDDMAIDDMTFYFANDTLPAGFQHENVVPEPASMSLLGIGLLGLARRFRRK